MKLDTNVRTIGPVDHAALKAAVCNVRKGAWFEDQMRQEQYKNVHSETQSIILLFYNSTWPQIDVSKRQGWNYFSPQAVPIMREIIEKNYAANGVVIRAVIAKLVAGGMIKPHIDIAPDFAATHRIHVPLVTNDMVDFEVGGEIFHLQEGIAYEISNLDAHGVHNRSTEDRIHFIFDYFEPKAG